MVATWSDNAFFLLSLDADGATSSVLQWFALPGRVIDAAVRCPMELGALQ